MKKLLFLVIFGALLIGGYALLWNQNADHLKEDVEIEFADINTKAGHDIISFTSLETSGFPGNITTTLNNAKFQFAGFQAETNRFDITRGFVGNTFTNRMGDLTLTVPSGSSRDKPVKLLVKSNNDSYIKLSFKENQLMNFFESKLSMSPLQIKDVDWKQVWENFHSYESKHSNLQVFNEDSGLLLLTTGQAIYKLLIDRIDPISHHIDLQASIVNQEFTPEFDQMIEAHVKQIGNATNVDMTDFSLLHLSDQGKSNLDIIATYSGITDFSAKDLTDRKTSLVIPQFDYSNRLQSSKMHGDLSFIIKGDNTNIEGAIDLKGSYLASPEMKDYLKNSYSEMAQLILANPPENRSDEKNQMQLLIAQILIQHADTIIPDLAKIGEMNYAFDVKFDEATKNILLNEISLASPKYSMALTGKGNFEAPDRPKGIVAIALKNYELLVSDLVDYAMIIAQIVDKESQGKMNIHLNPNFKKKLIAFLSTLATKKESGSNDITINISFDEGQIKVGEMSANQVLVNFMMMLGSS